MSSSILRAVEMLGSQRALAEVAGVSPQAVSLWVTGTREVSVMGALKIEQATDGAVTRIDLRPNDWWQIWPELADRHPDRLPDRPPAEVPEPERPGPNPTQSGSGQPRGVAPAVNEQVTS